MYFIVTNSILGADLPWISELFFAKRGRNNSGTIAMNSSLPILVFSMKGGVWRQIVVDLRAIFRKTGGKCIPYSTDPPP